MNLDQLIRRADFIADAVRASGTVSSLWTTEEKVDLANEVYELIQPTLRLARRHYFARRMVSTDSSATILGRTYAPSSLTLVADTRVYTLPPDFVEVIRLSPRISTTDLTNQGVRFFKRDVGSPQFQDRDLSEGTALGAQSAGSYLFDIQGDRTLRISPSARAALDMELVYVAQRPPLSRTIAGTVAVATLTVTGVSTTFSDDMQMGAAELILGTSGSATAPTPSVSRPSYPTVSTIDSNTSITLTGPTPGTYAAGTGYIITSVPQIPIVHHRWMASLVAILMQRKVNFAAAEAMLREKFAEWEKFVQPNLSAPPQSQDPEETEGFDPT